MPAKDRERPFQALFEGSPDAIFIEDAAGNVLDCNPAAAALHGIPREQIIGKNAAELVPPEHRSEIVTLQMDSSLEFEGYSLTADGRSIPVSIRTNRIQYLGQAALLLHVRDITAHKRFEAELKRANDQLESRVQTRTAELQRANETLRQEIDEHNRAEDERKRLEQEVQAAHKMEAVGRLAGGVAHDFNNLLTVIIGRSETLLGRLCTSDPIRPDLLLIHEAAQKAANVTRQLLAFGRKQVFQPAILNLNAVIRNMEPMLRSLINDDVELTIDLNPDLWSVEADRGQIEHVLMNLVVNAIDAMDAMEAMQGGGRLQIRTDNVEFEPSTGLEPEMKGRGYVTFSVKDTGRGMDAETLSHIFEPFFTTKHQTSGFGLGLPTAHGIVKQSGGYITAASHPGKGATFTVFLPGLGETAEPLGENGDVQAVPHGNETILVAEDSDLVRQLTRELLEGRGYKIIEAQNGHEALDVCRTYAGPIHLTLSDVVMPGMTGRELAEQVAQIRPDTKVLLMSGYTDAVSKSGFLQPGLHFIEKPFTSKSLALKIREVLDQSKP